MCKFESVDYVVKGAVRAGAACTSYYNHIHCRQKIHSAVKTFTESCQCKMYFEQKIRRDVFTICYLGLQISRRMRWAGHVAHMGEGRGVYRVLVGKPEGKRPLGRTRRRWEDNIRVDLQEVGLGYEDWNWLAQDRDRWRALVSAVRNLRVP